MKPIIGMLGEVDNELDTKILNTYVSAIEQSGGIPILLPYVVSDDVIERLVGICDGFFFSGGMDINPIRYGEEKKVTCGENQENRDEFELKIFEKIIKTNKPIIAICRGAQLVNIALGGTLYQDIPTEIETKIQHKQTEPKFATSHDVRVVENTPLSQLVKMDRIHANSFHHQAIKTFGKGLEVMAIADDNIVEAFYLKGDRYLRAYQWHPERLFETDTDNRRIFEDFISVCD